ncbi:MAG: HlyD family efflux transporter periplasmic adaptor subunit [Wenzhouxiangellaceae bacterium]
MSQSGLFRQQVVEQQNRGLHGDVVLAAPLSIQVLTTLLGLLAIAVVLLLWLGRYAQTERVDGWVIPDKGLLRLTAAKQGTVVTLHRQMGDLVASGDPILTLSHDSGLVDGGEAAVQQLQALEQERSATSQRLQLLEQRYAIQNQALRQSLEQRQQEQRFLEEERRLQQTRIDAADALYQAMRSSSATSAIEIERQREELLVLQQARTRLDKEAAVLVRELSDLRAELAALPGEQKDETAALQAQLAALDQRRIDLQRQGQAVIRAPLAGRIAMLPAQAGQSVAAQDLLATVLPADSQLQAELYVPTRAAGNLVNGQPVRLRYSAFPYQRFGYGRGHVSSISRSVFLPGDVPAGIAGDEPVYRVSVTLDEQSVTLAGQQFPLPVGMLLQADVVQQQRPLWQWLFGSLLARG